MNALKSDEGVVCDHSPRDESALIRRNNILQNGPESINQAFRNHFINNIAQTNRPKILQLLRELNLGDEYNARVIDPVRQDPRFKEILHSCDNVCLH